MYPRSALKHYFSGLQRLIQLQDKGGTTFMPSLHPRTQRWFHTRTLHDGASTKTSGDPSHCGTEEHTPLIIGINPSSDPHILGCLQGAIYIDWWFDVFGDSTEGFGFGAVGESRHMNQWKMQKITFTEDSLIAWHYFGTIDQACCAVAEPSSPTIDYDRAQQ